MQTIQTVEKSFGSDMQRICVSGMPSKEISNFFFDQPDTQFTDGIKELMLIQFAPALDQDSINLLLASKHVDINAPRNSNLSHLQKLRNTRCLTNVVLHSRFHEYYNNSGRKRLEGKHIVHMPESLADQKRMENSIIVNPMYDISKRISHTVILCSADQREAYFDHVTKFFRFIDSVRNGTTKTELGDQESTLPPLGRTDYMLNSAQVVRLASIYKDLYRIFCVEHYSGSLPNSEEIVFQIRPDYIIRKPILVFIAPTNVKD